MCEKKVENGDLQTISTGLDVSLDSRRAMLALLLLLLLLVVVVVNTFGSCDCDCELS